MLLNCFVHLYVKVCACITNALCGNTINIRLILYSLRFQNSPRGYRWIHRCPFSRTPGPVRPPTICNTTDDTLCVTWFPIASTKHLRPFARRSYYSPIAAFPVFAHDSYGAWVEVSRLRCFRKRHSLFNGNYDSRLTSQPSLRDPFHVNDLFDHYSFTMIQLLNMFLPPCKIRSPKKSVVGGLMLTVDHFAKELVILKYAITVLVILPIGLDWVAQLWPLQRLYHENPGRKK